MRRKRSELLQVIVFSIIALANLFLASRYWSRDDIVGMALFSIVVILSLVAAFGHYIAWKKAK